MNALFTNYTPNEIQEMLLRSQRDTNGMLSDLNELAELGTKNPKEIKYKDAGRQLIKEIYNEMDFQLYILHQIDEAGAKASIKNIMDTKELLQKHSGIEYPKGEILVAGL